MGNWIRDQEPMVKVKVTLTTEVMMSHQQYIEAVAENMELKLPLTQTQFLPNIENRFIQLMDASIVEPAKDAFGTTAEVTLILK